jgi:hypothetical protein
MHFAQSLLMPATYFGPVHYFVALSQAKHVIIEQNEHYLKQTWRNRCKILTANGVFSLTIPVIKVDGNHTKIKDILISYRERWQQIHWRAITSAYKNSPFFLFYADELGSILFSNEEKLFDFNMKLTKMLLKMLKINVLISVTQNYDKMPNSDFLDLRLHFSPKNPFQFEFPFYNQVFTERHGFIPGLSIIDLIFNLGPDAPGYLNRLGGCQDDLYIR